jgi:hypothetical protein
VLRHVLIEARTYLKLPTKRPKERPTHFRLKLLDKEGQETETLQAIGDKPVPLALPVLKYPRLLRNMPKINESPVDHFWVVIWWPKQGMSNKDYYGTENSSYDFTVEWGRFCRMLAKIGYSYAVAELGFGSFEPLVLDTILGTEDYDSIGHYVGGYIDYDPPSKERHELDLLRYQVGSARYWVAKIRLFAWLGAPTYFVVVGSAK